jgi:prophage regulatory protein
MTMTQGDEVLREPEIKALTKLSRTTRFQMARRGEFPQPVKLSMRATGILRSDLDRWMAERAARRG